ncbi:VWA domain-containing protein [Streptomyces zaomyceticus]|uniref:VWA domain-containing protein n=1 Tax=Streptomyces zaomyceticus TaxID=68286 RepID=UPI00369237ED
MATHSLQKTSAISLDKVAGTAPDLIDMYKDAETSLRESDRLGGRAAVYLVIDRSLSMTDFFNDGSVQRLSDQILSLSAHLDDDGKAPVGFFSTEMHTIARGGLLRRPQALVDVKLGAHQGPRTAAAAHRHLEEPAALDTGRPHARQGRPLHTVRHHHRARPQGIQEAREVGAEAAGRQGDRLGDRLARGVRQRRHRRPLLNFDRPGPGNAGPRAFPTAQELMMTRPQRPATFNPAEALLQLEHGNRSAPHGRPAQLVLERRHARRLAAHPDGAFARVPCDLCRKPLMGLGQLEVELTYDDLGHLDGVTITDCTALIPAHRCHPPTRKDTRDRLPAITA